MRVIAVLAMVASLAACGGGGGSEDVAKPQAVQRDKLLVIGNSLTRHPPAPELGWTGDYGMAASSIDKDYVHLVGKALGVPVEAYNYHHLETLGDGKDIGKYAAMATARTVVVVQLAENVSDPWTFLPPYRQLVKAMSPAQQVICLGSWWVVPEWEVLIKQACTENGGTYVYIGDLYTSPDNIDKATTPWAHPGVNNHPHDWGMARIAERVVSAVR